MGLPRTAPFKITDLKCAVIASSPVLKINTDEGVTGWHQIETPKPYVERSHLPVRRTLDQLGIARRTFYRWYDSYLGGGPEALEDRPSAPSRVWKRIPAKIHDQIIEMALEQSDLSTREPAVRFTDEKRYFFS